MSSIWNRGLTVAVVALLSFVIVADASAGHRRRRRGCGGCGGCGGDSYGGGYYGGKGGYGYGGYGGGYAGYGAPGYYGGAYRTYGTYGAATVGGYQAAPTIAGQAIQGNATLDAAPIGPSGTANADIGPTDRSARVETRGLTPAQGDLQGNANSSTNLGAPNANNADQDIRSNSDLQRNDQPQGNLDANARGSADANLPAAPSVAP